MTAVDWICADCGAFLPFGGVCLRCRDEQELAEIRAWAEDAC